MSCRSACSVPDLHPLTWPAVKLLGLSPPPPSASSHLLHNYSLSDWVIITAAIKSGFRSTPAFALWLCSVCRPLLLLLCRGVITCTSAGTKRQTQESYSVAPSGGRSTRILYLSKSRNIKVHVLKVTSKSAHYEEWFLSKCIVLEHDVIQILSLTNTCKSILMLYFINLEPIIDTLCTTG